MAEAKAKPQKDAGEIVSAPPFLPSRPKAPQGVHVSARGRDLRKEQLDALDAEHPEFVHMYQHPLVMAGDPGKLWDMQAKGQEVVKDAEGRVLHHMGDPVVRMSREAWEGQRVEESERSREDVEAVVKPDNSTVKSSPKDPKVNEERRRAAFGR